MAGKSWMRTDRPGDLDLAFEHDVRSIDDVQRLFHVVIGDQHADSPPSQTGDNSLDVVDRDGIYPGERFV